MRGTLAAIIAIALCSGCATQPPPAPPVVHTPPPTATAQTPQDPAPAEGIPVGTTASGGTIRVNPPPPPPATSSPAVIDSTPSPDALAVLSTIPEPLGRPSDRSVTTAAPVEHAPASAPSDTTAAAPTDSASGASTDSAGVPVPEPTQPLGDRPGSLASAALPDSVAAPPAVPPPASAAAPAAPISPDSCWRVQVAAPPERERAERLAAAARSQLVIEVVVEREGGLYKVRTKDCLTAVAADDLKRRAIATGFDGAFRFLRKR